MKRVTILMGVILIAALSFGISSCEKKQGTASSTPGAQSGTQSGASPSESMGAAQSAKVDINTASAQDFQTVPGIDATLAQNIVSYRDANGPFSSVDDLTKVQGMDMQKLDSIRSSLTVSQPSSSGSSGGTSGAAGSSPDMGTGGASGSGESGGTTGTDTSGSGGGTSGTDTSGSGGTGGTGSGGMNSGSGSTGF
jgi:competence ComEA-like helix-hairpin-helix protein